VVIFIGEEIGFDLDLRRAVRAAVMMPVVVVIIIVVVIVVVARVLQADLDLVAALGADNVERAVLHPRAR
jgi:hypothetical protein